MRSPLGGVVREDFLKEVAFKLGLNEDMEPME